MNFERLKALHDKNNCKILEIKPGMLLEIHENMSEGDTKKIWRFKGLVIKVKKPNNPDGSFTVRGEVAGVMIEKIYPLSFKKFEKLQLLDEFKTRQSKLYYVRDKIGKAARMKSKITAEKRNTEITSK